jgi:hypothetical protein
LPFSAIPNRLLHGFIWEHPSQSRESISFPPVIMIFSVVVKHMFAELAFYPFTHVLSDIEVQI